ncbi:MULTISPECIES: hypothetical protein [Sporosarcina]|uniref:hypothetical protein n=1 Tax=Sporosarcina TaxID=1569 RepID=UPI0006940B07|nr:MULTISPECIES: hypothetical protein [Sporosarcina]WJY27224.1 hypothetical protein QWT68_14480 [Sporosarcina sp. 0.2-SM1T-5]
MKIEQVRPAAITASLAAFVGLILMFASPLFGTKLGAVWRSSQGEYADSSEFLTVTKTYINGFFITGSILLAVGAMAGAVTYFAVLYFGLEQTVEPADLAADDVQEPQ